MAEIRTHACASNQVDNVRSAAEAWRQHEHVAGDVSSEVKKSVDVAGPIEVASDGLLSMVERLAPNHKRQLSRRLGYESFEALLAASMVMTLGDGSAWCLTLDRSGAWAAWNVYAIGQSHRLGSTEEALTVNQVGQK